MNDYDYVQICKLLTREETILSEKFADLQRTFQIFKKLDEYDIVTLLEAEQQLRYFNELSNRILYLIEYLLKNNKD